MTDQMRRLGRLEARTSKATDSDPASDAMSFARRWVEAHDVDPALLDRWLAQGRIDTDLRTYHVLVNAFVETWAALGRYLPLQGTVVLCNETPWLAVGQERECRCGDHPLACEVFEHWASDGWARLPPVLLYGEAN